MDQYALDPYEQQLLKVFNSHDKDSCGSLDMECLTRLCQTLQLEEQGVELVKCLMNDNHSRITFTEFKNALLALLGNMESSKPSKTEELGENALKTSPEREVSPKFVYGSKKYGRRSRPKNEEINSIYNEQNDSNSNKTPNAVTVQRSNSQSEVSSKKRKTNYKLKRCTSLPGRNDLLISNTSHVLLCEPELVCTEEMLREAWKKLGVGEDGYLNQNELVLVCDAIGLHKLADGVIRQLSDKLSVNRNHKISFQELLAILQQDDTWFEVLNETPVIHQSPDNMFPDSQTFHFITLGPDGNGMIKTDILIEMWENVGVHSPKELLHELGFNSRVISILELAEVLEKQMKSINEVTRSEYQSPQIALLQASLTLYQSEIKTFKNILEQMQAEREKLKYDVSEANNRATLLAQEVDDNHSRMEQNTLNQVKLLEQRHTDILKEVTAQFTKDKEQLSNMNQALEEKIHNLEQEVTKLKNDLLAAQKYLLNMEKENQLLGEKIADLEKDKAGLNHQIESLETDKQTNREMEREESQMVLAKLSALQLENSQLKDKNDEMVSEIESLSGQIACMRTKVSSTPTAGPNSLDQSMEENISIICEGVGLGAKRRSDYSPTKDANLFNITDGSPRLGKIRKFHNAKRENLDIPFASSESGFDTEVDCVDSVSIEENENIKRLQSKIAFLEQILIQNGIALPSCEIEKSGPNLSTNCLSNRVRILEMVIREVKRALTKMIEKDNLNCDDIKKVAEDLEKVFFTARQNDHFDDLEEKVCEQSDQKYIDSSSQANLMDSFEEKVIKLENENRELCAKCSELESCVELLRNEYEKCEDYWQNKVDDERQIFDAEQKINSDKLGELLLKMKEYEEQYANQELMDNRLPTIEETYNLEKQFTDLEQEFETYKEESGLELMKKDEEIALLKEKLTELALRQQSSIQVHANAEESRIFNKMKSLSYNVVENTCIQSEEMMPLNVQSNITSPPPNNLEYVNQSMVWHQANPNTDSDNFVNTKSLPVDWNFTNNTKVPSNAPSTSSSSTCLDNTSTPCTPCRPKRTRKFDKNIYKKNNQDKDVKKPEIDTQSRMNNDKRLQDTDYCNPGQTIFLPLRSFQNLNARRSHLEQQVRYLRMCLKQQHYCSEQTLQHYWLQFSGEKTDLHSRLKYLQDKLDQQVRISRDQLEKLERTDLLVKDLYIENAYLIASVQRLEQQCHMLAQCNSSSV
ncbi:unnamed protein product [Phaedon cochleariae]|nr:unnamed protein product [Phaedon cochleariae]